MRKIILFTLSTLLYIILVICHCIEQDFGLAIISFIAAICSALCSYLAHIELKEENKMIEEIKKEAFKNLNK